ncbi:MAG TPA: ABC transporter permease [Chthoniobacterales bacterium]
MNDLRYALRQFRKSPGFALVAIATLALGIGANTAIFSVVDAILLRPLPFPQSNQLVTVWQTNPEVAKMGFPLGPASVPDFQDWRAQGKSFVALSALEGWTANLTGQEEAERLLGARVSANLFSLLRVQPILGRGFVEGEDQPGRGHVAVLSAELWQRRFGGDPTIIGRKLILDQEPYTVVGVMPPHFRFPSDTGMPAYMTFGDRCEIWAPFVPEARRVKNRGAHNLAVVARLKPGVSLTSAQTEMNTLAARFAQQYPDSNKDWGIQVVSLQKQAAAGSERTLTILMCAVGCILLIASANVANLLLARGLGRQKEIAIRRALGASRSRIVRQLLTESVLLALIGGLLGTFLAIWGTELLLAIAPASLPRLSEVRIDGGVLVFTVLVALATGLLFGLAPALQSSRLGLSEKLKEGDRGSTAGHVRLRSGLIVSEVALALMLLIAAGLLIESFAQLARVQPGFNPESVLTFNVALPDNPYRDRAKASAFIQEVVRRIKDLPGVKSAAAGSVLPLSGAEEVDGFEIEGRPKSPRGQEPTANFRWVTPDYFRTLQIPLERGRVFTAHDNKDAPAVAIIDQTMARLYFPGVNPIGQRFAGKDEKKRPRPREIVGIVGDVRHESLGAKPAPHIYFPHAQEGVGLMTVAVRSAGTQPTALLALVRREVAAVDPNVPIADIRTMKQMVASSVAPWRFTMSLLSAFAGVALLLASVGIYGVLAYSVNQRRREIGIRMSLGAQPRDLLQLFLSQGMRVTLLGIVIGLGGAWAVTRIMRSLLYSVSPTDPLVFLAVPLAFAAIALLASFFPARKASRVNPIVALRSE